MKEQSCIYIINCLRLSILLSSLVIVGVAPAQVNQASKTKESSMDIVYNTESPAIPPIDAAISNKFETASFGLG